MSITTPIAASTTNNNSGGALPGATVPMRVYFKTNVAAAHSYNTVAIAPTAVVRDVVKLVWKKKFFFFFFFFFNGNLIVVRNAKVDDKKQISTFGIEIRTDFMETIARQHN
jgi:hypothetical protein